jgi:DNA-binding MarR family transcriptional regulator
MNQTVKLVNLWAEFEENHHGATIIDFCRYFLIRTRENKNKASLFDGEKPPRPDIALTKLMDRFARLHMVYVQLALEDMDIEHFGEFNLLSAIANLENPKKTEVIYYTITELSTGLSLLAGMKNKGYITEQDDAVDKRSKRLGLTHEGEKILQACYYKFSKIPEMLFMEIDKYDIELCLQLLKNIDIKFSKLWQGHKDKTFNEVYENVTGKNTL